MALHAQAGDALRCSGCGTYLRLEQVGGGTIECCGKALDGAPKPRSVLFEVSTELSCDRHVRCTGCGNRAAVLHSGGGTLRCCNREMADSDRP